MLNIKDFIVDQQGSLWRIQPGNIRITKIIPIVIDERFGYKGLQYTFIKEDAISHAMTTLWRTIYCGPTLEIVDTLLRTIDTWPRNDEHAEVMRQLTMLRKMLMEPQSEDDLTRAIQLSEGT